MSRLALYFLGPPRLELNDESITLSHHKALALLAYLAVTQQSHSRQSLAALLWPDYDPASARAEVRRMLWVLNKQLGHGWLVLDHQLVGLSAQPDLWLDVAQFRELAAVGLQHSHSMGQVCPACREPLSKAVSLVRGGFLAGFTLPDSSEFDTWQTFETESLHRELAGALERLIRLLIQVGEINDQTIAHARRWVALDPLHEPAHFQLMQLYAWLDQPTAAMRQYQSCVKVLKQELETSPSRETTALYEAIKRGDRLAMPRQHAEVAAAAAVSQNSTTPNPYAVQSPHPLVSNDSEAATIQPGRNLPVEPTPFIGRQQEVAAVRQLLSQESPLVRLVTLTGTGGTGKTRLSLQVAAELLDDFVDGVFFVPLANVSDPNLLASTIARHLDVREGGGQPLLQTLKNTLEAKQILLVLDNFEQIVEAAPIITELLAAAAHLKVLVTSRTLLRLRGEYEFQVPPLKLPARTDHCLLEGLERYEAVKLFVERAQATHNSFILTQENALAVAEICRRLDGLPLAIELAATRVKLLSPQTLLSRLSHRLKVLTGGPLDLPPRQQTLRNTIDWSYSLLTPSEQVLFNCLAVFGGGFNLETAETIYDVESVVLELAEQPLDILEGVSSLLNKSLLVQSQSDGQQPRFSMLETIREYALERLAERGKLAVLQEHHARYFARQIEQIGENFAFYAASRLDWAETEHDNMRAALDWSLSELGEIELGLNMIGVLYWFWYRRGYLSEGRGWCQRFMQAHEEKVPTLSWASFLMGSGSLALMQGDMAEAGQHLQESIAIFRELGDESRLATALLGWGVLALYQGDATIAQTAFEETLAISKRLDLWWVIADSLLNLGNACVFNGDYDTAQQWLEQAASVAKRNDDVWLVANVLNNLGEVARILGNYQTALGYYEESQMLFRRMDDKPDIARSLHSQGYVIQHLGRLEQAEAKFRTSLQLFEALGNKRGTAECLAGIASLAAERDQLAEAVRLLAAAEAHIRSSAASWWPADQLEYDRTLALIQTRLDQDIFETAWSEGQALSLAQAIALINDGR